MRRNARPNRQYRLACPGRRRTATAFTPRVFAHNRARWPWSDGYFAAVFAPDVLHRFAPAPLLEEARRVTRQGGLILFPHTHLSNSEPEPFFERGGRHRHGREYAPWCAVYSEKELFHHSLGCLEKVEPNPDTDDYNAVVALSDGPAVAAWPGLQMQSRLLLNPLFRIDAQRLRLEVSHTCLGGTAADLLSRHPVYAQRLQDVEVDEVDLTLLYWAARQYSLEEIAVRLNLGAPELQRRAARLCQREVLLPARLSPKHARLQHFLSHQVYQLEEATLPALWRRAVDLFGSGTYLECLQDGGRFTYAECQTVVARIAAALQRDGLQPGQRVALCCPLHVESALFFWAAVSLGLIVVPLDSRLPLASVAPTLVVSSEPLEGPWINVRLDQSEQCHPFSDWLARSAQRKPH